MKNMECYIWYQSSSSLGWLEGSGFIVFLLRVDFWNLVLRNRQNASSWMFEHDLEILICIWVKLIVMNKNEIIKKENNLDEVVRVHTYD